MGDDAEQPVLAKCRHSELAEKQLPGFIIAPARAHSGSERVLRFLSVTANAASPWGLRNIFGNAAEWTSTVWPGDNSQPVVLGGSLLDLPKVSTAGSRIHYVHYQPLVNVGFRVAMPSR